MMPRTLGEQVALSVGTAIPFEEQIVIDGKKPDALVLNVRTLFRNFWGAWSNLERPPVNRMFEDFITELNDLFALCTNMGVTPVPYYMSYASLSIKFPNAKLAVPKTDNQKAYASAEKAMMKVVLSQFPDIQQGDVTLPGHPGNVYLLSSYPVDLLSQHRFNSVKLLESHTGKLKGRHEWFSKLNSAEELQHLPFNHFMLQVFGDKSTHFVGQSPKIKKAVIKLALDRNWNQTTTTTRIRENLARIEDSDIRNVCLSFI